MQIQLNGEPIDVVDGSSVADLVAERVGERRGTAVAVNGAVVPGERQPATVLRDGDAVEVVRAVQGG